MDRGELMIKYGIKTVSNGMYREGFFACLEFMDEKHCELEELLKHIESELKRNPDILFHLRYDIDRKLNEFKLREVSHGNK